jgi:hypothetical protein
MIQGGIVSLIILMAMFFAAPQAGAFTLNNSRGAAFAQDEVRVNVAAHTCVNIGVTNDELLWIAEEAVNNFWNRVATSRLRLVRGSLVTVSDKFRTDTVCAGGNNTSCTPNSDLIVANDILISCNVNTGTSGNFSSGGVLAITVSNNISGDNIVGALILINDSTVNQFRNKDRATQIAVLAHEIGHAIGLGHSPVEDSLMYFTTVPVRSNLGWDDIDGVSYLYPTEQPFGGCGTVSDRVPPTFWPTLLLAMGISIWVGRPKRHPRLGTKS